jgi:hypothetical protein
MAIILDGRKTLVFIVAALVTATITAIFVVLLRQQDAGTPATDTNPIVHIDDDVNISSDSTFDGSFDQAVSETTSSTAEYTYLRATLESAVTAYCAQYGIALDHVSTTDSSTQGLVRNYYLKINDQDILVTERRPSYYYAPTYYFYDKDGELIFTWDLAANASDAD